MQLSIKLFAKVFDSVHTGYKSSHGFLVKAISLFLQLFNFMKLAVRQPCMHSTTTVMFFSWCKYSNLLHRV